MSRGSPVRLRFDEATRGELRQYFPQVFVCKQVATILAVRKLLYLAVSGQLKPEAVMPSGLAVATAHIAAVLGENRRDTTVTSRSGLRR